MTSSNPILAVTMGDPAGTGPELITRALADPEVRAAARPVVVGDADVLRAALGDTRQCWQPPLGLLHHSDRASQWVDADAPKSFATAGLETSMSRA